MINTTLRCRHGLSSGSACYGCGDVVPTLDGQRPWWAPLWRWWRIGRVLTQPTENFERFEQCPAHDQKDPLCLLCDEAAYNKMRSQWKR